MHPLTAFIKLLRPVNLLIIVATMYAMRFLVMGPFLAQDFQLHEFKFFLSVLVIVLIAAAGNIINDYFDVRVDRINKPRDVLIGKWVKRRVAMAAHHAFNFIACVIGIYLAWDAGSLFLGMIPVFMAASLWFYSLSFKKQPFIGNLAVAIMVGVVPLWSGIFELLAHNVAYPGFISGRGGLGLSILKYLLGFGAFAFLLTLIREAQKDLEDLEGDRAGKFRTLPIALGESLTRKYVLLVGLITFLLLAWAGIREFRDKELAIAALASLFILVLFPLVRSSVKTIQGRARDDYRSASRWSKMAMAGGILMSVWIYFFYS